MRINPIYRCIILLLLIGLGIGVLCNKCESQTLNIKNIKNTSSYKDNTKKLESYKLGYFYFDILEIKGHQYISFINPAMDTGGIIHSESCPCKNKKEK